MFVKFSKEYMKLFMKQININGSIQPSNNLSFLKALHYSPSSQCLKKKKSHIIFLEQPRAIEKFRVLMVLLMLLSLAIILRFKSG